MTREEIIAEIRETHAMINECFDLQARTLPNSIHWKAYESAIRRLGKVSMAYHAQLKGFKPSHYAV